jgi:hypothetical protein
MEDIKRTVSALTSLIQSHHRRINAYSELSRVTSHEDIKSLCERHINLSNGIVRNLSTWRSAYGGFTKGVDHYSDTDTWHQLRLIFSFSPEKTNINRCEQLEWETLEMYKTTMQLIPSAAVDDLQLQTKALKQMVMNLLEVSERKQVVGSLATK